MTIQENPAYAEAITKAMFGPGAHEVGTFSTDAVLIGSRRRRPVVLLPYAQGRCRDRLNSLCDSGGSTDAI
ncbi:MAG: hypothetical protein P8J24_03250 [Arenicellales bacterium]|nr:hypothetical protein [Arenicellales bacterium]